MTDQSDVIPRANGPNPSRYVVLIWHTNHYMIEHETDDKTEALVIYRDTLDRHPGEAFFVDIGGDPQP